MDGPHPFSAVTFTETSITLDGSHVAIECQQHMVEAANRLIANVGNNNLPDADA